MGLKGSSSSSSSFLLLAILIVFSSTTISAVNITRVLEKYPNFSTMNDLFTRTGLNVPINKRQTITILAVDNDAMGSISGRPEEEIKNILMNHVVLDYYDEIKLKGLKDRSTLLTTLYQTTGLGQQQNGFLNCTKMNGKIFFGSGVKGSPLNAQYVNPVFQNPFNLSVVQISMPIVAPGLGSPIQAPPPPPFTPPPAPAPKKGGKAPAPGPSEEDDYSDSAPETAPAQAPSEDDSPAPAPSNEGKKKMPAADESEPPASAASSAGLSFGVALLLGLVASFAGF
ncbi:PREDICTED: fasciclin-like arabinogalactan protein 3 [Tarenaya hassleriana]|uniref:fasciclin-like arabinogalactan protein 3 n=1 Tax=Tarenaya hassleriana TaxID=28532 RepID=UPI00053C25A5|nr:PREDICTED: fasciclin-like arabinogalactan protein 3 [Tarenaya hassleriana]